MNEEDHGMNYFFYLENYSIFFEKEGHFFVYNTYNGRWADCLATTEVRTIFSPFLDGINYSVSLSDEIISACQLGPFIEAIRDGFSGDLIPAGDASLAPFLFPSLLDFKYEKNKLDKKERALGHEVYRNLKEVSLFLHPRIVPENGIFLPEQIFYSDEIVPIAEDWQRLYLPFLQLLTTNWKGVLHVWCKEIDVKLWSLLWEAFATIPVLKVIHTGAVSSLPSLVGLLDKDNFSYEVYVTDDSDEKCINEWLMLQSQTDVELLFQWLISSEKEWEKAEEWIERKQMDSVRLLPFFNGANHLFFKENIFVKENDLLFEIIKKKDIFARKIFNTNYFGKLYIFPDGQLYAHPADDSLGQIQEVSLPEILYKELTEGKSWLLIRDKGPCVLCRYQWICPSPSDFERALDRPNLCHLKKQSEKQVIKLTN